jgi:hypothetical protein
VPIKEFLCSREHVTEKLFLSFKAAEGVDEVTCSECGEVATRIVSTPFPAHFYGNPDGYHKPSATKRTSYKLASERGNAASSG